MREQFIGRMSLLNLDFVGSILVYGSFVNNRTMIEMEVF